MLERFLPREKFDSYEDFMENYKVDIPDRFNFATDVVDAWAAIEPDKSALVWCNDQGDERFFSFRDISLQSAKAAIIFSRLGVKRGDAVLFLLKRRWQFWTYAPALMRLGAVFIPATIQLTRKDIVYRCAAATVRAIVTITEKDISTAVLEALPDCPDVRFTGYVRPEPGAEKAIGRFDAPQSWPDLQAMIDAVTDAEAEAFLAVKPEAGGKDPMLLYFTSGTTGMPKMVLHDYEHPLGHIVTAHYWQQLGPHDLHISVADTGWAKTGWGKIYGQWICGASNFVYDMDRFDPANLMEKISRYKVTTFCAPPTIFRFMIQEDLSRFDLSSLRIALTAGEPLNAEVFNRFKEATGLSIREGFGQTEGSVLCASFLWFEPKPGSMSKPSPLYALDIIDENGVSCPPGQEGHVVVTGLLQNHPVGLFLGYYRDEEATSKVWHDGIYETGDVAWRDEDGFFWYVGRSDDVIKCSGYRIGPFEVESALQTHDAVLECAVTAAPDPVRGQVVKATIILAKGYTASPELARELQEHVKKVTAPYKYPRIVEFVDALPKTISGKIRRVEIRGNDEKSSKKAPDSIGRHDEA